MHQLTDYAQIKSDAQIRNNQIAAEQQALEDTLTNNLEADQSSNDDVTAKEVEVDLAVETDDQTGDANPNHGYETDGDVTLVGEQNTAKEARAQTDFDQSNPQAQALDYRVLDAESTLNERMSYNHSRHESAAQSQGINKELDAHLTETTVKSRDDKGDLQDDLHREEDDKV